MILLYLCVISMVPRSTKGGAGLLRKERDITVCVHADANACIRIGFLIGVMNLAPFDG